MALQRYLINQNLYFLQSYKSFKVWCQILERAAKPANIARAATKHETGAEAAAASTGISAIVSAAIIVGGVISDFYHGYNSTQMKC